MKIALGTLILILLLSVACDSSQNSADQKKEQKLVRTSFKNYKAAILKDDGEEAVKFIDSKTIKYYSDLLHKIINADSLQVNSLNVMDKFQILTIRFRTSKDHLISLDGKKLLAYTIDEGMTSKNVAGNKLGDVIIDGNFAKGQLSVNGQTSEVFFNFYKEEGNWQLDLTSIFRLSAMVFNKMIKDSGQEENEFIFTLLETISGNRPSNEIWKPL